jgi:N-methylhydantoinase A
MANAVRAVTTERGLDPRDFTLIAYGGGGPPHAVAVARELGIGQVVIPQAPAHFSAFGMLMADIRRDYVLTHFCRLADVSMEQLESLYGDLELQGQAEARSLGVPDDRILFERAADMRYVGQEHAVAVPVPADVASEEARAAIRTTFDEEHELRFSHSAPDEPTELVSLRVSVFGRIGKPQLPRIAGGDLEPVEDARRPVREVILDRADQPVQCAVFDRLPLLVGNVIVGPAVIEEPASSTLLDVGDRAVVNEYGHLVIELRQP